MADALRRDGTKLPLPDVQLPQIFGVPEARSCGPASLIIHIASILHKSCRPCFVHRLLELHSFQTLIHTTTILVVP